MAGIGLQLRKLVERGTYFQAATAYLSSAIISAGPWLSAVTSLSLLGGAAVAFLGVADRDLLFATITYSFGLSLILAGAPQMIVTRYLADRLYLADDAAVAPACAGVLLSAVPLLALTAPAVLLAPLDLRYRLLAETLFLATSLIWLLIVFLSAARDYMRIVLIFAGCYLASLIAAIGLGRVFGVLGGLGGFTFGQVICVGLLVAHIYHEFGAPARIELAFLAYVRRYWDLAALGLLSSLGIWLDNITYWFAPGGVVVGGFFHVYPPYDSAKLLAYLTTIPAAAVFLVRLETDFYLHYRTFYQRILKKGTLMDITDAKRGMVQAARSCVATTLKIQAIAAAAVALWAPDIVAALHWPPGEAAVLRVCTLGASFQFVTLLTVLLLLYLDERRAALAATVIFSAGNALFTGASVALDVHPLGIGYLAATLLAMMVALTLLGRRLVRLEYRTFMLQPMGPAKADAKG